MRIVCLSDTHNLHGSMPPIPDGDLLLHAGDISASGNPADIVSFNTWLGTLPHRYKVCTCGNHDFCFEREPQRSRALLTNAIYLQDQSVQIEGLTIYGSPWQPWFMDWAFNLPRGSALADTWAKIPSDTDILITHGPPFGILDRTARGELVGCEALQARLPELTRLKLHLFGHIHEDYGQLRRGEVTFVNASICNLAYEAVNSPIVVEIACRDSA